MLGFLARVLLVYALADEQTRLVLWTGFAFGTVVNVLDIVEAFAVITPSAQAIRSRSGLAAASERIGLAGGVPAVLFPWAYYQIRRERTHPDPALRQ